MSTATSALLIAIAAAACGPNLNTQSGWAESNKTQRAWCASQCDQGDDTGCSCEADWLSDYPKNSSHKDWQDHSYQLDRAKAKTLYERLCEKSNLHQATSCNALVNKKLYSADEMIEHCNTNQKMCDAASLDLDLPEQQRYQLTIDHPSDTVCSMAVAAIHDSARSAEATMICGLDTILRDVEAKTDDDDDDAATGADAACHKDTDCKGDRICQAGNCVDANAPKGAPKAPEGPFKLAGCDAFVNLHDSRLVKCSQLTQGTLDDQLKYMKRDFPSLPKDRYDAVGARCSDATSKIESLLAKLHC